MGEGQIAPKEVISVVANQEKPLSARQHFFDKVTCIPKKVALGKLILGARIEETFLKFCTEKFELPERGGKLPKEYSNLSFEELQNINKTPEITDPKLENKKLEMERTKEAIEVVEKHKGQIAIVRSEEDLQNPLGEINGPAVLLIKADEHYAPSYLKEGTRANAFKRYGVERTIFSVRNKLAQLARFGEVDNIMDEEHQSPGEVLPSETLARQYVISEDVRNIFNRWVTKLIRDRYFDEEGAKSTPIVVNMGDKVHDGAFFLDGVVENTEALEMLDEASQNKKEKPKLIDLYGNHDQDPRVPESMSMLTEVFGHRIFTQEINGVLIAAVDTNIENPEWENQFKMRADENALKVYEKRKKLQEEVVKKIKYYKGRVILMGHNPSRIIDAFAVKNPVIQNSNVVRIIAGHTHNEDHLTPPFINKNGEEITLHVVESTVRFKNGQPQPPKLFSIKIENGQIGKMNTLTENQDRFKREYGADTN